MSKDDTHGCTQSLLELVLIVAMVWVLFAMLAWLDQRIMTLEEIHDIPRPELSLVPNGRSEDE